MPELTPKEKRIMRALYNAGRPISTNKVAEIADMSWNTANDHLQELKQRDRVAMARKGKKGTKKVWYIKS